ncbi:penicillin-binding protein 2 [Moraxella macacae 0408225]|uniref:Peptidoglycan D,D-transpeptidase MrdA n=1 Tax=Moraxella macacae 0408225 TaxID=1230338 RepID=L2F752_9GAMM|nr:penicillin-binding protein 2 [Moraxella macacae]ELA08576.1 penicillin-binding protein 2 [Moraxella macacae 0408225]
MKVTIANNNQKDHVVFKRRVIFAGFFVFFGLLALVARYAYLQIYTHEKYATQSDNNRIKLISAPPSRGYIYDRNGYLLADNRPVFTAVVSPDGIEDPKKTLELLTPIFQLTPEEVDEGLKALHKSKNEPVTIKIGLTEQQVAQFSERKPFLKGVSIQSKLTRSYPHAELFAHVIGYVGRINDKESENLDKKRYAGTDLIGKLGIEKQYETLLLGKPGYQSIETNAYGDVIRKLDTKPPIAGNDLYLSLDYGLQKVAHDVLAGKRAALVAIDPNTGEVLAFVSNPSFDPNPFISGISSKAYKALQDDPNMPLYNRALQGQYPPASTIKPFAGLGLIDAGIMTWESSIFDPGYFSIPGDKHKFRDWKKSGHGTVNLHKSITQSVDTYYYKTSYQMGIDRLHDWMTRFNFGKKTGIDLPHEKTGVYPSTAWKMKTYKKAWRPGETISASIGQGYFLATPLQVANATAMLAATGQHITPHILQKSTGAIDVQIANKPDGKIAFNGTEKDWKRMQNAMEDTVKNGTAKKVYTSQYRLAGKTGTAQVKSIAQGKRYNESTLNERHRDHGWFIAFAPVENPQIAVALIVENGRGGSIVAPLAKQVIDYWILQRDTNPILPPTATGSEKAPNKATKS